MDKTKTTPKDFFLWAGAVISLYVGVFNYIGLLWDYINYTFPDPLQTYWVDPYQNGVSWEMASLIVLTPAFILLMFLIRRDIAKDTKRRDTWVRRWALYLTVFLSGAMIVGDLIYVLYAFLNGTDVTARFLLKALTVLLVASIGLMHFLADVWNYWQQYPMRNRSVGVATVLLVVISVVSGFFIVGTPNSARLKRFDDQKVSDLTDIQNRVVNYWQQKSKLPATLTELVDPLNGIVVPIDVQTGSSYEYEVTGQYSFKLCATFNSIDNQTLQTSGRAVSAPVPAVNPTTKGIDLGQMTWQHGSGQTCFSRTIDPERYPPFPKTKNI